MARVYSVFDRSLREFKGLMTEKNDETMRRSLLSVRGSGTVLEKHPEDFDIWCVGSFDEETGVLMQDQRLLVAKLSDVLEANNGER